MAEDFVSQLRALADRAVGLAGQLPAGFGVPPGWVPQPGALSAAQLRAIAQAVAAQRVQLQALTEQFGALDAQLEVLEDLLRPLVEWSSAWADVEAAAGKLLPGGAVKPASEEKKPD